MIDNNKDQWRIMPSSALGAARPARVARVHEAAAAAEAVVLLAHVAPHGARPIATAHGANALHQRHAIGIASGPTKAQNWPCAAQQPV